MSTMSTDVIRGFTLYSLLSIAEMNSQTQSLKVRSKGRVGHLFIEYGKLVGAETFELSGKNAAIEIINWIDSEIEIINVGLKSSEIQLSLMKLILEAEAVREAHDVSIDNVESNLLFQAISHLNMFRYKEARELLARLLKSNPRHAKGWYAYSQSSAKVKTIDYALTRAAGLMPEDPEIVSAFKKFRKLKQELKGETLRRCPFCGELNLVSDEECRYCMAFIMINLASLDQFKGKADDKILETGKKRLSDIFEQEANAHICYCLGLYYYNKQHWKKALDKLNDAVQLSGNKAFYSSQLSSLLKLVSAKKTSGTEPSRPLPHPPVTTTPDSKQTIMVVEDSSTTRKVISIALNNLGKYRVIEAGDGLEALGILHGEKPDLILLDIILPKMNGYEILSIIKNKSEFKEIPVIMLTSRDGLVSKMKGKIAGASAYLTKPFKPEVLISTIEKHMDMDKAGQKRTNL